MLEIARLIVDSGWIPPRPVLLLFNGAEELFMLVICLNNGFFVWEQNLASSVTIQNLVV